MVAALTEPEAVERPEVRSGFLRRWAGAGLALLLALAGAGTVAAAEGLPVAAARVVGGNLPVAGGAIDPLDVGVHNSPTLRSNPTDPDNLVIVDRVASPRPGCGLYASFDGGARWAEMALPVPAGKLNPCFSPDLAFGVDGVLYPSFTSFAHVEGQGIVPDAVWVASSRDGGRTVSAPVQASGPMGFQVRVIADQAVPGRVYLAWVQVASAASYGFTSENNPVVVSRSDDAGATWAAPVTVNARSRARVVAPALAGAPEALYVAYLDVGDDRLDYSGAHEGRGGPPYPGRWSLVLARSSDGGVSWTEAVVDSAVVPTERFLQISPPTPSVAVDPNSGRIHIGFHDGRAGDADVWVWSSGDPRRWEAPERVNDTGRGDGRSQYLPQLAVAPDGRLDVVYYDRRGDADNHDNEVSLQSSFDGGDTFGPRLRLSDAPFDSRRGIGRDRGLPDLGNRLGLVSADDSALAVWADTRAATDDIDKQVLARSTVAFTEGSPYRRALRITGWVLVVVAGMCLALVVLLRLTSRRASTLGQPASYSG